MELVLTIQPVFHFDAHNNFRGFDFKRWLVSRLAHSGFSLSLVALSYESDWEKERPIRQSNPNVRDDPGNHRYEKAP